MTTGSFCGRLPMKPAAVIKHFSLSQRTSTCVIRWFICHLLTSTHTRDCSETGFKLGRRCQKKLFSDGKEVLSDAAGLLTLTSWTSDSPFFLQPTRYRDTSGAPCSHVTLKEVWVTSENRRFLGAGTTSVHADRTETEELSDEASCEDGLFKRYYRVKGMKKLIN